MNGERVKKAEIVLKKVRQETVYICTVCPDEPGLSELSCFGKFNKDLNE